ncbi:MAG TPA: hypothetical protein VGU68_14925, partial [Ktedonobacteraceae bacterium]|nr:hypothetical protein [Ktedonobacteraceae bacterium]
MRLAILASRIRVEEKLLVEALRQRTVAFDIIDDEELLLDLAQPDERWQQYDAVLCRSLSQSRAIDVIGARLISPRKRGSTMRLAILASRIRVEEKLLVEALRQRAVAFDIIDDEELLLDLAQPDWQQYDAVLCRSLSQSRALAVMYVLEHWGIPVYNSAATTATCNDKLLTTLALLRAHVPVPRTMLAFAANSAVQGIETLGYPAVLKPVTGSWGRLLARVNDRDAAEAVLEHQETLGGYQHHIHYIQQYI